MRSPQRRRLLASGLAAIAGTWLASVQARDSALPVPASLQRAAQAAQQNGEPLVLLVSLPGCPYCELVRRTYLLPMRAEGLHAWQLDVTDRRTTVRGFAGETTHGAALATQWNARFTPTVLFFNAAGAEIAPRLVGIAVPDLYGAYLDEALAVARKRLSEAR